MEDWGTIITTIAIITTITTILPLGRVEGGGFASILEYLRKVKESVPTWLLRFFSAILAVLLSLLFSYFIV